MHPCTPEIERLRTPGVGKPQGALALVSPFLHSPPSAAGDGRGRGQAASPDIAHQLDGKSAAPARLAGLSGTGRGRGGKGERYGRANRARGRRSGADQGRHGAEHANDTARRSQIQDSGLDDDRDHD